MPRPLAHYWIIGAFLWIAAGVCVEADAFLRRDQSLTISRVLGGWCDRVSGMRLGLTLLMVALNVLFGHAAWSMSGDYGPFWRKWWK